MKALLEYVCAAISAWWLLGTTVCECYVITVDALETDCFYEKVVSKGSKMNLVFETIDGGFLDIDVELFDPDNASIYRLERERHGKFVTSADRLGNYHYCFSNKMSTVTPKVVRFDMEIVEPDDEEESDARNAAVEKDQLEMSLQELGYNLVQVERTQKYVYSRDVKHNKINANTNACITLWVTFHAVAMVIVSTFQVYYLKSYFEIRRMV